MAKRLNENNSIKDVLKQFVQQHNLQGGIDKVNIKDAWKNLMGNGVNSYTKEIMLKNGTLYIELTSAVLREELSYGKEKIIKMINEEFKREVITQLILR